MNIIPHIYVKHKYVRTEYEYFSKPKINLQHRWMNKQQSLKLTEILSDGTFLNLFPSAYNREIGFYRL